MFLPLATDSAATISSLATAGGTLVLAVATFASVRSANRATRISEQATRISEQALREQRQPVFAPSRFEDPIQKIMFVEQHWVRAEGGRGVAEHADEAIYLALSLRNVGAGIGVCQGWYVTCGLLGAMTAPKHAEESTFRTQSRDLYIPAGDIGMWQGALRDPEDHVFKAIAHTIDAREPITIELLYSDQVGEQRTISRFGLLPMGEDAWIATSSRHWFLERRGPRSEEDIEATAQSILRRMEAASEEAEAAAEAEISQEAEVPQRDGMAPEPVDSGDLRSAPVGAPDGADRAD
jgi:hypothetical protein